MRAVVQRVSSASVTVDERNVGRIGPGLCVLLGVRSGDGEQEASWMAEKLVNLRIFEDENGKLNRSLLDAGGAMLIVSQFTLYGDCRNGRRPSFIDAALPDVANAIYERFVECVRSRGIEVATGEFQTHMVVSLSNDGPVTLIVDSPAGERPCA